MNIRFVTALLVAGLTGATLAQAQTANDLAATDTRAIDLSGDAIQPTIPPMPNSPIELRVQSNRPLKLQDAVNLALERSPQLQLARLAVERAEAVVRQAQAGLYPTVSLSANYTYNQSAQSAITRTLITGNSTPTSIAPTTASTQAALVAGGFTAPQAEALAPILTPTTSTTSGVSQAFQSETSVILGQVSLNYNIFTSGLVGSRILAAEQSLRSSRLDFERVRQDLLNGVIGSYYDLQASDGNVEIGVAAVRSADISLRDAQAQERAGVGTRFAVLQSQVQRANAVQQRIQAENQRTVNRRNLARLLNFLDPTDVTAADTVEQGSRWTPSIEDTILQAYRGRVELEQQIAVEQAAKAQEAVAYASIGPQVSIFLNGQAYDNVIDSVPGIYTGYSVGAQIQWLAFDGGAAIAQAAQSAVDARSARVRYVDTRNAVRFSVENSYSTLQTSDERINSAATALTSAEEALRLARLRFQAGVGTQTDVITAERDLTQARVNRLIAIIDYNRALAAIRRATGTL